ncbi:DEAD/DEAH box helicase [Candidatus Woesearchaeota archaeon]|nr:DEAD/DEAH box helicase [Candidatus Woesearchaeota archaeon]
MLKNFKPRLYQETIFDTCTMGNTLVVLPTGMGKTSIAFMLAMQRLNNFPNSKIVFLAPTRPLVEQHMATFLKYTTIREDEMTVFTGFVSPEKRKELWKSSKVIFTTPQGLENDVISGRIPLADVSLMIFDEAHRAVGDYSYGFIAKQFNKKARYPKILALTASPGSDTEKINEVCSNLFIDNVEIRSDTDPDVKPYIQEVDIQWAKVNLPESFKDVQKYLNDCFRSKIAEMYKYGYLKKQNARFVGKVELLKLQGLLHSEISKGNKDFNILKSISLAAEAMKVQHAIELLETQGISPLYNYLEKLREEAGKSSSKAVKNLVSDINFKSAYIKTRSMHDLGIEHPKLEEMRKVVEEISHRTKDFKILIFTQFRDSASIIERELNAIRGIDARIFVGQAKKGGTGLSQKEQKALVEQFSNGEFNVMVATSVAEEGLDIPKVDLVIFYEPIPSAIRHIQRRGRTGRLAKGSVVVLMARGTRDEGYKWSAHHKERRMHSTLRELKKNFSMNQLPERKEEGLNKYFDKEDDIKIFADDREKGSGIIKELADAGMRVDLKRLAVGDYVISGRCAIEYKKVPDFVDSIIDGRLLDQIKELKKNFCRPVMIVEGTEDIYSQRNVHPNAIRGMISTIAVSYGIPIVHTRTFKETSALVATMARREQEETSKDFSLHGDRKPFTLKEQQEYIISSLPGVGSGLAKPLLKEFGSVKRVINASADDLKKVDKIGDKKAREIQRVLDDDYIL